METHTMNIPKISCGHCVNAIKNELMELSGISTVEGDPAAKTITVSFQDPATMTKIKAALKEIDYPVEE